jgi:hypothetical protein
VFHSGPPVVAAEPQPAAPPVPGSPAVRRIARRRGYHVSLSRRRDPLAADYGRWTVTGPEGGRISPARGWSLEQVERWLGRQEQA